MRALPAELLCISRNEGNGPPAEWAAAFGRDPVRQGCQGVATAEVLPRHNLSPMH